MDRNRKFLLASLSGQLQSFYRNDPPMQIFLDPGLNSGMRGRVVGCECLFVCCVARQQLERTRIHLKSRKARKEKTLTRRGPMEVCPLGIDRYQQKFSEYRGIQLVPWQWAGLGHADHEGYRTCYRIEIIPCEKTSSY